MGISQLLFKKGNEINTIEVDVIIEESVQTSSTITSNPVESGADVNDHIIINPLSFTMSGVVSNTKVAPLGGLNTLSKFTDKNPPATDAWTELLKLQSDRVPFKLKTNLKVYPNVVIESLSTSQNKDTSNALFFTANMKEIIFVGTKALSAEQFKDADTADKSAINVDGGIKQ